MPTVDTKLKLGSVIDIKGNPLIKGEVAKMGQEVFEGDDIIGIQGDMIIISGKSLSIIEEDGDVLCTPTKLTGNNDFECVIEQDLDLEAMWDNVVWEEITNITEVYSQEVENITATAGVRG
jgi:hypothetical protein